METPNVIIVLAAGVKQNASSRWVSTDLSAADNELGSPGGTHRIRATVILGTLYPHIPVLTTGGKGYDVPAYYPDDRPLLCEIMQRELCEAGVPAERILFERESNTTYQQLKAIATLARKRGWAHMAVVTSRWHVPRVRAMIENKLPELGRIVTLVSAEELLLANDPEKWESDVASAYASEWLLRRIEKEEQGIRQIKAGTYDFK